MHRKDSFLTEKVYEVGNFSVKVVYKGQQTIPWGGASYY